MERPAQYRNKFRWFVLMFFCSCSPDKHPVISLSLNDKSLSIKNGILYHNDKLFSGSVYALHPNNIDTAFIQNYQDGVEDGESKKFFSGGRQQELRYFKDGMKTGTLTRWWPNGVKMLDYHFNNGEYEGLCREWNQSGILVREMNYANGYEAGSQKMFYDNGKIRSNYVIVNGRRFGLLGTKNCVNTADSIPQKKW